MRRRTFFLFLISVSFLSALSITHLLGEVFETSEPEFSLIAPYYDDRKAVATVTADDWKEATTVHFEEMSSMLTACMLHAKTYTLQVQLRQATFTPAL